MKDSPYFPQAKLMLEVIPHVAAEECFALKGGTAINLFVREMPRLSVDIDLAYLPIQSREESLRTIGSALGRIGRRAESVIPGCRVTQVQPKGFKSPIRLVIRREDAQIKVEPNTVLRGAVYPPEERGLVETAIELFELSTSIQTLSFADLFASKICAALDRQHPRDLFDVKLLLESEGIDETLRKAFIVYLCSHPRPMGELLRPNPLEIRPVFESEFLGMVGITVSCEELEQVRDRLPVELVSRLTAEEKRFVISVKTGEPDWKLLGLKGVDQFPAIRWKLENIQKMGQRKRESTLAKLMAVLED